MSTLRPPCTWHRGRGAIILLRADAVSVQTSLRNFLACLSAPCRCWSPVIDEALGQVNILSNGINEESPSEEVRDPIF